MNALIFIAGFIGYMWLGMFIAAKVDGAPMLEEVQLMWKELNFAMPLVWIFWIAFLIFYLINWGWSELYDWREASRNRAYERKRKREEEKQKKEK